MNSVLDRLNKEKACPGLGLSYDPSDHRDFSNPLHFCYYQPRPDAISPQHQESYCLKANHVHCPIYLKKLQSPPPAPSTTPKPPPTPVEPRKQAEIANKPTKLQPFTLITILLSVVFVILLVLIFTTPNLTGTDSLTDNPMASGSNNTPTEITPNATWFAELTQQVIQNGLLGTPSLPSDLFPSRTSIAYRSPTVIICTKPDDWIVYQVVEGDTLISLGSLTGLTAVDLMAANCLTTNSLVVGQQIFVPYYPGSATATGTATRTPTRTLTRTPTSPLPPTSKPIQPTATYTHTIAPTATNTIVATTVNPLFRDTPTPVPPTPTDTPEPTSETP